MQACPSKVASKKLLQTLVDDSIFRKFKKIAVAAGNTKAGYLRHLVQTHVLHHDDPHSLALQFNAMLKNKKAAGLKKPPRTHNEETSK
jgi:hypothetical protein